MKVYVLYTEQCKSYDFPKELIAGVYTSRELATQAGRRMAVELFGTGYDEVRTDERTTYSRYDYHLLVAIVELQLEGAL